MIVRKQLAKSDKQKETEMIAAKKKAGENKIAEDKKEADRRKQKSAVKTQQS